MPSSPISQAALIHNNVDMADFSLEDYLNFTNNDGDSGNARPSSGAMSAEEAGSVVNEQDTPMTGTQTSLPGNTVTSSETSSSKLKEKLLAARKPGPSSHDKSSPLKNASTGDEKANATPQTDLDVPK